MNQFNVPKRRWDANTYKSTHNLYKLAGDIEAEELETQADQAVSLEDEDLEKGPSIDNNKGWVDEQEAMTEDDLENL
jgi:hypothetical protein